MAASGPEATRALPGRSFPGAMSHARHLVDEIADLLVEQRDDGAGEVESTRRALVAALRGLELVRANLDAVTSTSSASHRPARGEHTLVDLSTESRRSPPSVAPETSISRSASPRAAVLVDDLPVCVLRGRREKGVVTVNRRWTEVTGLTPAESRNDGWLTGFVSHHRGSIAETIEAVLDTGHDATGEWRLAGGTKGPRWVQARIGGDVVQLGSGTSWTMVLTELEHSGSDVAELTHRASHDLLTGLANREIIRDRTEHALSRRGAVRAHLALLFIDLDRFKEVNDSHGHAVGDVVLGALANRLRSCLRPSDTLARVGGDEFVALCEDLEQPSDALTIVNRILAVAAEPVPVEGSLVSVKASVGIAFASDPDDTFASLLEEADRAMFRVKDRGGDGYWVG